MVFDSIVNVKLQLRYSPTLTADFAGSCTGGPFPKSDGSRGPLSGLSKAGVGSDSFDKIVSAWCAPDPKRALTLAKSLQPIDAKTCDNPVSDHLQLEVEWGLRGRPRLSWIMGVWFPAICLLSDWPPTGVVGWLIGLKLAGWAVRRGESDAAQHLLYNRAFS